MIAFSWSRKVLVLLIPLVFLSTLLEAAANPLFEASRTQIWRQDSFGLPFESPEDGDQFGRSLATGDFDCDGYDDLAIGVPLEDLAVGQRAGVVHVVFGSATGLVSFGNRYLTESDLEGGASSAGAEFGKVLASGDFDGDGCDDLAIGVPEFDDAGLADSGAVWVVPGGGGGLEPTQARHWTQEGSGVDGALEALDHFGSALASGDINGDGFDDLVIAAFGEALDSPNEGAIWVLPGSSTGLLDATEDPATWLQLIYQDLPWVPEGGEQNDFFGSSLATCDFDGDGRDDIAVGVSGEDDPDPGRGSAGRPLDDNGAVHFFFGSSVGINILQQHSIVRGFDDDLGMGFSMATGVVDLLGGEQCAVMTGAPYYQFDDDPLVGAVVVILNIDRDPEFVLDLLSQGLFGESMEEGDLFGWAIASGRFSASAQQSEWAFGSPGEHIPGAAGANHGMLHSSFMDFDAWRSSHRGELVEPTANAAPGHFGEAMAVGDFDNDGLDDLAVAAPRISFLAAGLNFVDEAGIVQVHYASGLLFADDLETGGTSSWSQTTSGE